MPKDDELYDDNDDLVDEEYEEVSNYTNKLEDECLLENMSAPKTYLSLPSCTGIICRTKSACQSLQM